MSALIPRPGLSYCPKDVTTLMNGQLHDLGVCVVTVTYGQRWKYLALVLSEVVRHHPAICSIVVVDNGCIEPVVDHIAHQPWCNRVMVVRLSENQGSAGGFRAGLEAANRTGADLIWLLDDDNRPHEGALGRLLAAYHFLNDDPNNLLLCLRRDRQELVRAAATGAPVEFVPNSFFGIHVNTLWKRILTRLKPEHGSRRMRFPLTQIGYAPYGGLLMSRKWIAAVGLPDARYFAYADDHEFTQRITRAGGRIFLCAVSEVEDLETSWNRSYRKGPIMFWDLASSTRIYYGVRNRVALEASYRSSNLLYGLNLVCGIGIFALWAMAVGRSPVFMARRFQLIVRAVTDGLAGSLGKRDDLV